MDLTLDRMYTALVRLDLLRPSCTAIQVVGTNGKGSTSTFLASLSTAHGMRTGLYTSPHFVSPRERILYNGSMLSEDLWVRLSSAVYQAEPRLTYFEFLTVLAALAFAELDVELAVLEAGLGGRWDATTALPAQMLCIAPISMDHEHILGSTLHAIAADKADAIRPDMTVLYAPQHPDVLTVLRQKAHAAGANVLPADTFTLAPCPLGLAGPHQQGNAQLALAAWRTLCSKRGAAPDPRLEAQGLARAFLPGRLQSVTLWPSTDDSLPLLLDGAHNPHGLKALRTALTAQNVQPSAVIFSCLGDKDMEHMLPLIREVAGSAPVWIPTIAHNARAASGETLAAQLRLGTDAKRSPEQHPECSSMQGTDATAVPTLRDALEKVRTTAHRLGSGPVLLCGSLYLLGEFFEDYPHFLQSPHVYCEVV